MSAPRGFTQIELTVSLAIVALMVGLGVPSYRFIVNSSRISSQAHSLLASLRFARAEALRRGLSVSVCSSRDGHSCAGSSNWKTGWLIFVDGNNNAMLDSDEAVLRQQAALAFADTVNADNSVAALRFNREGFAAGLPADPVTITFSPPDNAASQKRCLAIGAAGRMQVQQAGTGSC